MPGRLLPGHAGLARPTTAFMWSVVRWYYMLVVGKCREPCNDTVAAALSWVTALRASPTVVHQIHKTRTRRAHTVCTSRFLVWTLDEDRAVAAGCTLLTSLAVGGISS